VSGAEITKNDVMTGKNQALPPEE